MWSAFYCLLIFISVLGVLQIAAAYSNLRGLLFFRRTIFTVCFAVLTIGSVLAAFFTWYFYTDYILIGTQQFFSFGFCAVVAVYFTLVVSSLINSRRLGADNSGQDGLDAFKESTFFQVIRKNRSRKD
jgi:hypothetical protein